MFGADVNKTGVQSVWIELRNQTPEPLWLLRPGSDPDYFSPLEVAWSVHTPLAREANARIDDHFDRLAFKNPILPGETRAGVLFINPERLTRLLNIDLLQRKGLIPFSLFLRVPDDDSRSAFRADLVQLSRCRDHRLQGPRRAARGAGAAALLRKRCARHGTRRSPQCRIRGRVARHRRSARAPQLPPRRRKPWTPPSRSSAADPTSCCASRRKRVHPRPGCACGSPPFASKAAPSSSCRSDGRWAGVSCLATRRTSSCMRTWTRREIS